MEVNMNLTVFPDGSLNKWNVTVDCVTLQIQYLTRRNNP